MKEIIWFMICLNKWENKVCMLYTGEFIVNIKSYWQVKILSLSIAVWLYFVKEKICFGFRLNKSDIVVVADLTLRNSAWGNMNINGSRHYYEVYFVSWKTEPISMRATAQSVRFVSESNDFGCSSWSKKYLCSNSSTWNSKNVFFSGAEQKDGQQPCQLWDVS